MNTKELLNLELQTYTVMLFVFPVTRDATVVLGIQINPRQTTTSILCSLL